MNLQSMEIDDAIELLRKVLGSPVATRQIEDSKLASYNFSIENLESASFTISSYSTKSGKKIAYSVILYFGFTKKGGRSKHLKFRFVDDVEKASTLMSAAIVYIENIAKEMEEDNDVGF